jgi:hypothetical protein
MRDRWETLDPRTQALVAYPLQWLFWFLLNIGPFAQPLVRTIIYAFLEAAFFTAALIYVTRVERERRNGGGP